jgi:hypothetical protein
MYIRDVWSELRSAPDLERRRSIRDGPPGAAHK